MKTYFLGIDVGSISTDFVVTDTDGEVKKTVYLKTEGDPIGAIKRGLLELKSDYSTQNIAGVGTTGSGRALAAAVVGADMTKNEITAHGVAAARIDPKIRTVIEIGGQDSKIILLEDGLVRDFAMNTVCAAGTGSFLDRQAERIGVPIEKLGPMALLATEPVSIAGRCAVFAESDLIHKQQTGVMRENLIAGMCKALVRNYLSNVAGGKKILPKVAFQGGVAANVGIKKAFEEALQTEITVPQHHKVMGAYGAALLASEKTKITKKTGFKGFELGLSEISSSNFMCSDCSNNCEVISLYVNGKRVGCFQDRCSKYRRESSV